MANAKHIYSETFLAGEDLSESQFHFVKLAADGDVELCDTAGDLPIGVLQNKPNTGHEAHVMVIGRSKLVASEAIAPGSRVGTHTDGRAKASDTATEFVAGIAYERAAAAGQVIDASINCATATKYVG